jgi:hypothetical protein
MFIYHKNHPLLGVSVIDFFYAWGEFSFMQHYINGSFADIALADFLAKLTCTGIIAGDFATLA